MTMSIKYTFKKKEQVANRYKLFKFHISALPKDNEEIPGEKSVKFISQVNIWALDT
jgi:hypothetical protein